MAEVWILLFALGLWKEQRKKDYSGLVLSGSALIPLTLITNNGTVFRDGDGHLIKNHSMEQEVVWDLIERGKTSPLKPVLHIDRFEDGYDMSMVKG